MSPMWGGLGRGGDRQENQVMTAGHVLWEHLGLGLWDRLGTQEGRRLEPGRSLQAITVVPDPRGAQGRLRGHLERKAVRKHSPGRTHPKASLSKHLTHCLKLQPQCHSPPFNPYMRPGDSQTLASTGPLDFLAGGLGQIPQPGTGGI